MFSSRVRGALRALAVLLCVTPASGFAAVGFYTQNGKVFEPGGLELQVRGISHFGFNTPILQPQYLWQMGWKEQIAQIKALGFNAVRVPYVPDTLYNTTPVDQLSWVEPSKNPELLGKTPLQVLDLWMAEADRQGLYVLLDFHSVSKHRQYPTWFVSEPADFNLIYNNQAYTKEHWQRDLAFVAARYAHLPRFFGIDVYNEPNGGVRWSSGDANQTNAAYFWKGAVEGAANAILAANPRLLIFVQGTMGNFDGIENSYVPMNWGENFQPQGYKPFGVPYDKLVLTPHTYGPDVYVKSSFGAGNFPANLAADWNTLFGNLYPQYAVVVGEWGGKYGNGTGGQKDITWQNAFVDYLLGKNLRNTFYWCYTPNSHDTGGILDDNLNVRQDKLALLQRLWGGAPSNQPPPQTQPPPPAAAPIGTFSFVNATYSITQGSSAVSLTVKRDGSRGAVTVRFKTANGTARASRDYHAASGVLSWAAGDSSSKTITVRLRRPFPYGGARRFSVVLYSATGGAVIGEPAAATININGLLGGTPLLQ